MLVAFIAVAIVVGRHVLRHRAEGLLQPPGPGHRHHQLGRHQLVRDLPPQPDSIGWGGTGRVPAASPSAAGTFSISRTSLGISTSGESTMNRRIVLIAVAVVLALFGTFAVYSYAHNADERAVAGGRAVKVLVATKRVSRRHLMGRRHQERHHEAREPARRVGTDLGTEQPAGRRQQDSCRAERHRARTGRAARGLRRRHRSRPACSASPRGHRDHGQPARGLRRGRLRAARVRRSSSSPPRP